MAGPALTLPVAVTVFPKDIPLLPRSWIEDKYTNLIHYAEADKGGHFAALEQPESLVDEIRVGLRSLRGALSTAPTPAPVGVEGLTDAAARRNVQPNGCTK